MCISFVSKVLFCITLKEPNYFITETLNNQSPLLVWQRTSIGVQPQYLPRALMLFRDFNHWVLCAKCMSNPCSRDMNQKGVLCMGQGDSNTRTYSFFSSHLQKPTCRQIPAVGKSSPPVSWCAQLATPQMRVSTPLIALYAKEGPNLGLKETLPDKKTQQFSCSLRDLQMPPAQTSPGHTVRIDAPVVATLLCCPCTLVSPRHSHWIRLFDPWEPTIKILNVSISALWFEARGRGRDTSVSHVPVAEFQIHVRQKGQLQTLRFINRSWISSDLLC